MPHVASVGEFWHFLSKSSANFLPKWPEKHPKICNVCVHDRHFCFRVREHLKSTRLLDYPVGFCIFQQKKIRKERRSRHLIFTSEK